MDSNLKYKSVEYWNDRYKDEDNFDWFGDFEKYQPVLEKTIKPEYNILVLGKTMLKWCISTRFV